MIRQYDNRYIHHEEIDKSRYEWEEPKTDEENYCEIEKEFLYYLKTNEKTKYVSLHASRSGLNHHVSGYCHRWSSDYARRFFYRLFLLEKWYRWHTKPVTFFTLTTRQDMTIPEQIVLLKEGFNKVFKSLKKQNPKLDYLAAMDFHETGYGHYHVVVFDEISKYDQDRLKRIWSERLHIGNFRNGLNFRIREPGEIAHIVNYLFKHAGKIFSGVGRPGWLRFHSIIWWMWHTKKETGEDDDGGAYYPNIRLFSMSKGVSQVMKIPESDLECLKLVDTRNRQVYYDGVLKLHPKKQLDHKRKIQKYINWFDKLEF